MDIGWEASVYIDPEHGECFPKCFQIIIFQEMCRREGISNVQIFTLCSTRFPSRNRKFYMTHVLKIKLSWIHRINMMGVTSTFDTQAYLQKSH